MRHVSNGLAAAAATPRNNAAVKTVSAMGLDAAVKTRFSPQREEVQEDGVCSAKVAAAYFYPEGEQN